jgi:DNA-binding CsgD family transcriptional regulator/tetratricopeptide (TPR) repeat protein
MLIERYRQSSLLRRSLTECLAGAGGLTVIRGPVGSGKTELLHSLAREAADAGALFLCVTAIRADRRAPLSVVDQVFAGLDLSADEATQVSRLLTDAVLSALLHDCEDEAAAQSAAPVLEELTSVLLAASEDTPVVVAVDDAHFMDAASLRWLHHLIRRVGRSRVLVVLAESSSVRLPLPLLSAGLLSQSRCCHVRSGLLSPHEVKLLLAEHPEFPGECDPALCYEVTGGNLRLLNALIEDCRTSRPPAEVVGAAFGQAVLTCLFRSDPMLLPFARALAVLDEPVSLALLSDLLGLGAASINWALDAAKDAGLLAEGRFRHQRARSAVLDVTTPQEQADLHKSVAHLLYRNGAAAVTVARHEIAAYHPDAPWSTRVLREAAEQALDDDDAGLALDCLRLAERGELDEAERASIQAVIVRAKWRVDPASAARDIWELLNASRAGCLDVKHEVELVNHMSWYGRPAEAAEVLKRVRSSAELRGDGSNGVAAALRSTGVQLAYTYPGVFERTIGERLSPTGPVLAATSERARTRAVGIVDTLLTDGLTKQVLDDANALLHESRLNEHTYEPIMQSLGAMVLADCLTGAAFWCDALLREAEERRAPTWCAQISAIRAMISLRQGDLVEAERHGRAALSRIQPRGLGIFIGCPLSTLTLVAIRIGQYDTALNHLSVPVPDAMFQTPVGLRYLRARGRYYLARQCYREAVEDFEACGKLMDAWGIDLPGLVPWRTDLAEAHLGMGIPARDLAVDQLARLGPFNKRTRGISLRVLAAATELKDRSPILREAVDVLRTSGDQVELADALLDLSNTQYSLDEHTKARVTGRRAQQIAAQCKMAISLRTPSSNAPGQQEATPEGAGEDLIVLKLSDAERRVASLAAQGYTNRQISSKLYITVSTVEQHLTRVYRKLEVKRRADLPVTLLVTGHHLTGAGTT